MKRISAFKPVTKQSALREYFRSAPYIKRADQDWLKALIHAALTNSPEIRSLVSNGTAGPVDPINYNGIAGADIRLYVASNATLLTGNQFATTIEEYDAIRLQQPKVLTFTHLAKRGTHAITVNVRCTGRRIANNEFPLVILTFDNAKQAWSQSLLLWKPEQDTLRYEVFKINGRDCYAPPRTRKAEKAECEQVA